MEDESLLGAQANVSYHASGQGGWRLPVITPARGSADLMAWLGDTAPPLQALLARHGALLFRGFGLSDAGAFARAVEKLSPQLAQFDEESSPRRIVGGPVSTSTDYPAPYPIQFHNEFSYSAAWPLRLFFYCQRPAERGGETPIADSRRVLARISSKTRARFEELGVLYVRRFSPELGVDWRRAFHTADPSEVLAKCDALGIQATWDGGDLRTRQTGAAIVRHPQTAEESWFNHAFFFNVRSLEPIELRQAMMMLDPQDRLTDTFYGDGAPIEDVVIEELRQAYSGEELRFPWQAGDLLMIDNMLCSHSRAAFRGVRQVFTVMTDKIWRRDLEGAPTPEALTR